MTEKVKKAISLLIEEVNEPKDLLTLKEAMAYFNFSKSHLFRLEAKGKLKIHRLSARKLYVSKSLLEAVIKGQ